MLVLQVVWLLVTFIIAGLLWFQGNLPFTAAFCLAVGITFSLLLAKKWTYGIAGLCACGLLFYGVNTLEPGWLDVIQNIDEFFK